MAETAAQDLGRIVESAAAGDEVAFSRIVAAYHEQLSCICVVMCRDRALAEDAVQSAWSRVWRRIGTLRDPGRLRPWVVSVTVNEARQLLRQRRRHAGAEVLADPSDEPGGIDPATGIAGIDLRDAMGRLDPDDRALLVMRYVLGFDATELASALGLSPSGTRSRLGRLLARLRQDLR